MLLRFYVCGWVEAVTKNYLLIKSVRGDDFFLADLRDDAFAISDLLKKILGRGSLGPEGETLSCFMIA